MKSIDTFDQLFVGGSLKLESIKDHTVNMKFNVLYSTFTNVFFIFPSRFNLFYFNLNVFFTSML